MDADTWTWLWDTDTIYPVLNSECLRCVQCCSQLPRSTSLGNHSHVRAWSMSAKASDAAWNWVGIIPVGELSSDSRLCPDMLFWQLLHESNPEKHPISVKILTFWYTKLRCQKTTLQFGEKEKAVLIQEYNHLQLESRTVLEHTITKYHRKFSKAFYSF